MAMRFACAALAGDGRPVLEGVATIDDAVLQLRGTAVVFEATIELVVRSEDQDVLFLHAEATAGGPARGDWSTEVALLGCGNIGRNTPAPDGRDAGASSVG